MKVVKKIIKYSKIFCNIIKIDFFKKSFYGHMVLPISVLDGAYARNNNGFLHKGFVMALSYTRNTRKYSKYHKNQFFQKFFQLKVKKEEN